MFAYCLNDPIRFADDCGTRCVEDRPDGRWVMVTNDRKLISYNGKKATIETLPNKVMPIEGATKNNDYPYYRSGNPHSGTDFPAKVGTPVHAVASGTVTVVSTAKNYNDVNSKGLDTYGMYIKIRTDDGVDMIYAHLSAVHVVKGQSVKVWDVIGLSGNTGKAYGPHLHFQVNVNGKHVNPYDYLP